MPTYFYDYTHKSTLFKRTNFITAFLNTYKIEKLEIKELVSFPRQEIANFKGLRVETVIRAFSQTYAENKIEITDHKLYY